MKHPVIYVQMRFYSIITKMLMLPASIASSSDTDDATPQAARGSPSALRREL